MLITNIDKAQALAHNISSHWLVPTWTRTAAKTKWPYLYTYMNVPTILKSRQYCNDSLFHRHRTQCNTKACKFFPDDNLNKNFTLQ